MTNQTGISSRQRWRALGVLLLGTVFVSLITTFASLAYAGGATPMTLVWTRFIGLVLVLGLILKLSGAHFNLPLRNMRATFWIAICLLMMSAGYLSSVAYIKVSLAVIILYTYPLLVAIFVTLSGRERLSPLRAVLLLVAFCGLLVALGQDLGLTLMPFSFDSAAITIDWRGAALALVAALGLAVFITWAGPYLNDVESRIVNFWANLWMILMVAIFVALNGGISLPVSGIGWVGYVAATLCYIAAMVCWFASMKILRPTETAMTLNLEPAISLIAASVILGEATSPQQWIGTLVLLGAIVVSSLSGNRHND